MGENESQGSEASPGGSYVTQLKAGDYVYRAGDAGDVMYIVQQGVVEVFSKHGKYHIALLEEGDFFGETAILESLPRVTTARAKTDCELLRIDSTTFTKLARHNPEIPIRMLRKLLRRLREISESGFDADLSVELPVGGAPPAPRPKSPPEPSAARPRLVHVSSGTEFPLVDSGATHVGRSDPITGFYPEVELKDVDPKRSTSRQHARVTRRGDAYFLTEELCVANGTFVNDERIAGGVDVELHDGDTVRFGLVEMVFHRT